ncbi:conjugal transfer protein TrbN [Asaia spathodeae NBRC 105894]|nr:conjugal transfer protein TrbN [Asaia spathodeae NBRC 105894]
MAQAYKVPIAIIEAVSTHTHPGGIGIMGIDPGWLPILERAGFDAQAIRENVCINIAAGAWVLAWANAGKTAPRPVQNHSKPTSLDPIPPPSPVMENFGDCIRHASQKYRLPEVLFRAILLTEGGHVGAITHNKNGSYDMGPAQINSSWLPRLSVMGIARERVLNDGCLNIHIGAWILATALGGQTPDNPAEFWRRVGNYNSGTPVFNKAYQARVWANVTLLSRTRPAAMEKIASAN